MLNLSELTFKVNTDALVQAAEKIAALGKSVEDLQGSFSKLERGSAASEKALAEANKKNAQAAKANAEAALLQAKALTEVERAENLKVKTIQASTKATEESTRSVSSNVSMLQRQQDIYGFMIEGFSRGQSSILATAKAAGILADEMKTLKTVLQDQRTIMGGDPFDKSLGSMKSLQNEFKVLKEVQRLYTAEIPLTRKQMENLALDKLRLVEAMKAQGKSFSDIKVALQDLNAKYITTAGSINRLVQAENQIDKAHKDTAKANEYLEREMQRVNYALQTQNNELNKGTANALFRFEQNLKRSGLTLAEQKKKLDDYRTSLLALEKAKGSTQTDYISRALGPQITDIFVGLATGQNPLTVMLQQGGQLRDQFALAGIAAEDMGNTMRTAARSMVTSVAAVAGAFKDLLVGAFLDTGKGITDLTMRMTGLNAVFEATRNRLLANGGLMGITPTSVRALDVFKNFVEFLAGGSLAIGVGTMIALGAAMVQVIRENDKMAVQLGLTGAAMGLTFDSAQDMSKGMQNIGISTSNAMKVLSAMAKEGNFVSEEIRTVTKAAIDLNTYGGVAIEDTVKQFAKMKEKPVESLLELSKATGLVSTEVVKSVIELEDQGRTADATAKAIEELARVNDEQVERMKNSYNGFSLFMIDLGKRISKFFSDAFKDLFYASTPTEQLKKQLKAVDETLANWGTMDMDIAGAIQAMIPGEKERVQLQRTQLLNQIALLDLEKQQYEADQKSKQEKIAMLGLEKAVTDEVDKQNLKRSKKKDTLAAFTSNFIEEKIKDAAKARNLDVATIRNNEELIESYRKLAKAEWEASQKQPKKDPTENYYATLMREATNATIKADEATQDLTKSQIKMLEVIADPRFSKLTEVQKSNILNTYAKAAADEKVVNGQELINKLLGKGEGLGKEYYATLAKLESLKGNAGIDQEQLEKALQALRDTTPEAKRVREEIKAAAEAYNQYSANAIASLESTKIGNQQLDYRLSVLGKSTEEQRKMKIQQDAGVKLMQAEVKYAKEVLKIRQDTKLQNDPMLMAKALQDAETAYAEERKLINREVAVEAAEDFQKEFDRISGGVTDSIVTALFEGGKSGSKKFRDLVVAELKKPVTLVVSAVVNTVLGNIIGSLMGGAASGAAGGAAGGIAGSIGSSIAGSAIMSGIGMMGTEGLANIVGMLGGDSLGVLASGATGGFSSAIGAAISQIPVWGWIAAGLAAIATALDDSGTYHTGGAAQYSAAVGLKSGQSGEAYNIGFGRVEAGAESIKAVGGIAQTLGSALDATAVAFGKKAGYEIATAFADDTSEDGAWGALRISKDGSEVLNWERTRQSKWAPREFGDGEGGYKEYLAAVANDYRQALMDSLGSSTWAKDIITAIGDSPSIEQLTSAVQEIVTLKTVFESLKRNVEGFGSVSEEVLSELVKSFGGAGNLTTALNQYYSSMYSEEEKAANTVKHLNSELEKQNLVLPKSREEYRKLVEAQDLTTESGRKVYQMLINLAPTFDTYAQDLEETQRQIQEVTNGLLQENAELNIQHLELLGEEEKALTLKRLKAIEGLTDYQVALWDSNKIMESYNETLRDNAAAIKDIESSMPGLMKKFLSEDEWTAYQTGEVAKNLVKSGIAFDDITQAIAYLNSATKDEIGKAAGDLFNMAGLSLKQKQVLIESAGIMADLKDASSRVAENIKKAFTKAGDDIVAYIKELTVGRAGMATPMELLDKTRQVYTQDLAAANAGDSDAAGRLVQSARAYIDAQKTVTTSSKTTDDVIKTIISQLSSLGFVNEELRNGGMYIPQYANGGVFTNSVVTQPTMFSVAQMGEAGPEAIMPLSRSSDGRLGVSTDNSSTNKLIERLLAEVQTLREQQSQETAGIISTNISVTEGTAQAVVDKLNEKNRQASSQPTLN